MAKHTTDNTKLSFHTNDRGWYYHYGPKPSDRKRFGTGESEADIASYTSARDSCLVWLWTREVMDSGSRLMDSLEHLSEYRFNKIFRDNIKACKSVTVLNLHNTFRHQVDVGKALMAGDLSAWVFPTLFVKGKKAHYKVDLVGLFDLDWDTSDKTVMAVENFIYLWFLFCNKRQSKWQRHVLELLGRLTGIKVVKHSKDFPQMWQDLLARWMVLSKRWEALLDELFEAGLIEYEAAETSETKIT